MTENRQTPTPEERRQQLFTIAENVKSSFISIKTPISTGVPCIYDKGYYNTLNSIALIKGRITAVLNGFSDDNVVNSILGYIIRSTYCDIDLIEKKDYVCLNNGLLNLNTMELEKFHPSKVVFYRIPVDYAKAITAEQIYNYVSQIISLDQCDKLQEHCGNLFASHYLTKKLMYALGGNDSGKSTFYNILMSFLGKDNYCTLNLNELGERFINSQIHNKRANICSDIPYKIPLKYYGRIKQVTGGDPFTIEFKHKNAFSYRPIAKQFFSGNGVPMLDDRQVDDAFYNRFDFIDFPYQFENKGEIENFYTTDEMKSALLNWMIEGYQRLKKNNWKLTDGDTVDNVKERFSNPELYDLDDFSKWLTENYKYDSKWIEKRVLWYDCCQWHRERKIYNYSYISSYDLFCKKVLNNKFIGITDCNPTENGKQIDAFFGLVKK